MVKETDLEIEVTASAIKITYKPVDGHVDFIEVIASQPNSKEETIKEIDMNDINEDGTFDVIFGTDDNLKPESQYELEITPISGNKRTVF